VNLPELRLAPFATQQLQIASVQKQLGIPDDAHWALVTLTTDALPDDLIAVASSRDTSGRYGTETKFMGGVGGHYAGGEWRADANHNAIAAITNVGTKPTDALLTLHYDNGEESYEMQRTIPPGDQMWVNLAQLVHNRVPDRKGNTLPADLNSVTYDLQDLTPGGHGLIANAVALDNTYGSHVGPQYANCCGYAGIVWDPDEFIFGFGSGADPGDIEATDECTGDYTNISFDFSDWSSSNTSVAQVTTQLVTPEGAGQATAIAEGDVLIGVGSYCAYDPEQATAPVDVVSVNLTIQSSGTPATDNSARGAYNSEVGTYNLGPIIATGQACSIGYQVTGAVTPSTYAGTINLVRTMGGVSYTGSTGQTVANTYPSGTSDTSKPQYEDTNPQSGGSNGVVYDLDAPGVVPAVSQVGRIRYNLDENAQLPDGTYVSTEVAFYVRVSCNWGSTGNSFRNDVTGDNTLGMGVTKTSWNLQ
jgi:hypothetical protein